MKILLFNLGSIEKRIVSFDLEGYSPLFENDVIIWGPVPNESFVFKGREIPIISIFEPVSINDVFKRLPEGWFPDIVTCETSVLNYVPDIYLCPVKTILFTRDSWADTIFNRKLVELFDFVPYGVIDRSVYFNFRVNILPLTGFAVSYPHEGINLLPFKKRTTDVISIANYNNGFYHERYKTLFKLASSNQDRRKIKFAVGLKRSEIHYHYQHSKIVVDWSHTLSNRSYEAALNGCLIFSHEDNPLVKEFWIPFEEYVPFNEDNIIELLHHYLDTPEEAVRIVNKAREKIMKAAVTYGQYVQENINMASATQIDIAERIKRGRELSKADINYRTATPFVYNYKYNTNYPPEWKELYFDRIDQAIQNTSDRETNISALIEAARLSFLLKNFELSLNYLDSLVNLFPDYGWSYYLKGRIFYEQGKIEEAFKNTDKAIDHAQKHPEPVRKYILPVIEKGNPCDGRRVVDYLWEHVYGHKNEFQAIALLHLSWELEGDLFALAGDTDNAINAYSKAISFIPVPRCINKACDLLVKSKDYKTLLDLSEKGIEDSPYDSGLILFMTYSLISLNKKQDAIRLLKDHRKALGSFTGNRRLAFIRRSMYFIVIVTFFFKKGGSYLCRKLIRIGNGK